MRGTLIGAVAVLAAGAVWTAPVSGQDSPFSSSTGDAGEEAPAEAGPDAQAPAEAAPREQGARPTPQRDQTYELTLRELEDELNELKDDIFGSKSRLFQLREQILNDPIGGSRTVIVFSDDVGGRFDLVSVNVGLDSNQIYAATDATQDLDGMQDVAIFDGAMTPGLHNVSVRLEYVGNGFGMFSYMNGYRVAVRSSQQVMIDDGMTAEVEIRGWEDASNGNAYEERPSIEFNVRTYETDEQNVALADDEAPEGTEAP